MLEVEDEVCLLGELVGAYQLSHEEHVQGLKVKHLRPYCVVKFRNKTIHYSAPCHEAGRDPIWTISSGSLFLVKVSPSTLARDNLQVCIWTRRNARSLRGAILVDMDNYFLGKVNIGGQALLSSCTELRLEFPLKDRQGNAFRDDSTIALRFRLASESDIRLIALLRDQGISPAKVLVDSSFRGSESRITQDNHVRDFILGEGNHLPVADVVTEKNEAKMAGDFFLDTVSAAFKPSSKCDHETGLRKVRVKPGPDPTRIEETKYLSPFEISKETREQSQCWVEAGSGRIGTLHLEILSCHDLPNVDVGEAVGNLSDAFVVAVFEDVMLQTTVIDDELSPHWLPWTQRAFRVGIVHPSSVLFLGVFDYDFASEHEAIGRVTVNLSNFQSNTVYTLSYNLHPTSDLTERTPNGSITIRLRIEYTDEKAALMAALQPKPTFHVNTRTTKTFKVLRYTCFGEHDIEEKFSWAVTRSYICEAMEYWGAIKFYFGECIWSLIFWRGQIKMASLNLPVHSAVLFISSVVLIERPWLIVPFCSLFCAWFMLAAMAHRRQTPSPWHTCTSFLQYAEVILAGKSSQYRDRIRPSEFLEQTEEYDKGVEEWKEQYENSVSFKAAKEEKLMTIGNDSISTEVSGQIVPLDLLERLGRYQGIIGRLCKSGRRAKSIIIWEDSMASFWITAQYLLAGLVGLLLPWRMILYFVGKFVVWGCLGPHMKLVDMYLQSTRSLREDSELEDFRKQSRLARTRREEAVKLKDMKCLAFGGYAILVPSENLPRHYDRPLHASYGRRVPPSATKHNIPATSRIPGQQLYGSMIPHTRSRWVSHLEEARTRQMKLASLEEQVARLQCIEKHLSSRPAIAGLDKDLPDHLGYEVTLCDDTFESQEESHRKEHESMRPEARDNEVTLALLPVGFKVDDSETEIEYSNSPSRQSLGHMAGRFPCDGLIDEDKEEGCDVESSEDRCDDQCVRHCDDSSLPYQGEIDQEVSYMAPLFTQPSEKRSHPKLKKLYLGELDLVHDPDDSHMVHLTHRSGSQKGQPATLISQDKVPENYLDENVADMTARNDRETEANKCASFTWSVGSNDDEKKEPDLLKSPSDLTFVTPKGEEEGKEEEEEQQDSVLDFLELKLPGGYRESVTKKPQRPSCRRQFLDRKQNPATVSVKNIGSGSVNCLADQPSEPKRRDKSVQVKCIGSGSLITDSKEGFFVAECKASNQGGERIVSTNQVNVEEIDAEEMPTPVSGPNQKVATAGEESMQPLSSQSEDNFGGVKTKTAHSRMTDLTVHTVPSSMGTSNSIMLSDTDATAMTNNVSSGRLPSCSQSLRMGDTADPMTVRRTWSSGSLQREKTWIKENPTDSFLELSTRRSLVVKEEGLEIVAMGRLRTIGDDEEEDSSSDAPPGEQGCAQPGNSNHRGLSVPYKSNSFVQVAHYRP